MAPPKRPSLVGAMKAAKDAAGRTAQPPEAAPVASQPSPAAETPAPLAAPPGPAKRDRSLSDRSATTALHIPREQLHLLRLVAVARANREGGGRPSVSNVLRELIEANRAALEREAAGG
ncbi:hypothetical protein GXW78_09805 [Roseomonas terrae]|uniref:Ribbon-helix-helix protein CopG domain-containing protein n=1 Tax=Neoroseomonas terrae TaxID=424799 RepID=A0ABS5EG12_9PROT|nr:hypothetical protein [Neoroseomonas terrae]MBR0649957.1 hypothetical protein [Neoroseomonas terrae]